MRSRSKRLIAFASIALILLAGYGLMRVLVTAFSMAPGIVEIIVISLMVIAVGLLIPFLMLKKSFHDAHTHDKNEKELHLKDLPKSAAPSEITYK